MPAPKSILLKLNETQLKLVYEALEHSIERFDTGEPEFKKPLKDFQNLYAHVVSTDAKFNKP